MDPKVKLKISNAKIPEVLELNAETKAKSELNPVLPETVKFKQPEMPEAQPERIDTPFMKKADTKNKLLRPDNCEFPPPGTCMMELSKKERKKYMWMIPDELKNDPMYDKEPEECKIDVCKMKREERENDEKKEKKHKKDQEDIIKQQAAQIQALIAHTTALTQAVNSIITAQSKA